MDYDEIKKLLQQETITNDEKTRILDFILFHLNEKEKQNRANTEAQITKALQNIPAHLQKLIPPLEPEEKLIWIENALSEGLFNSQGTEEIGSEIKVTEVPAANLSVKPMSEKDILSLPEKEYQELRKSGKLDYLIRNNLITD